MSNSMKTLLLLWAFLGAACPAVSAGPANDNFTNRLEIATPSYEFDGSIYGATTEPGEPLPAGATQTLWWDLAPAENGTLNLNIPTAQFSPIVTVYDGNQFSSMTPVPPTDAYFYYLQSGHDYSIQLASGYVPAGGFSMNTRLYSASNDTFASSEQVSGTNITYMGNFTFATVEPGEPVTGASNTVWMSWVAPDSGYVSVNMATAPQYQSYAVYTGSSVDQLQAVSLSGIGNSVYQFIVTQGTVYHFQFSGGADNFTFYLQFHPYGPCSNDNFADAQVVKGYTIFYDAKTVVGATMELGEPLHMGNIPQKSIWWKWQAPLWGNYYINPLSSLASNYVMAVYTGDSVEALTLVAKATNQGFRFPVTAGQTYHFAAAVPTNDVGEIIPFSYYSPEDTSVHIIPGNLLQEPSWEGTGIFGAQYWHWTGQMGGNVGEPGDVDGTTWPVLGSGTVLWQDFPTIVGHVYTIQFAYLTGSGEADVAVVWGTNQLGISTIPADEAGFWHWDTYTATATATNSRITFTNLAGNLDMDAFSVVDATAPPSIVNQPTSESAVLGGTAQFVVGIYGSSPLTYQWYFNGSALAGQTNKYAFLNVISTNQAGDYYVVVTNNFGAVTSAVASLTINAATSATILSQPFGDTVPVEGYFDFTVVAAGPPPLSYQWFANGQAVDGATNNSLMLTNVQVTDAGSYQVSVQNPNSLVWSLPVTLSVNTNASGGGMIDFRNLLLGGVNNNARFPVYDVDGVTALNGSNYLAQLYAGPSLDLLRPAAQPTPFQTGTRAGYFVPQTVTLGNVQAGSNAVVQVCVWDATYGTSYEQARTTGGRFGRSAILQVIAGGVTTNGVPFPPPTLQGLQSFSLQAGLPYFEVGVITFVGRQQPNTLVWSLRGLAGSIYLIEKSTREDKMDWQPFTVITNATGIVTFTDQVDHVGHTLYRARILD
jgi:hypothetical protein